MYLYVVFCVGCVSAEECRISIDQIDHTYHVHDYFFFVSVLNIVAVCATNVCNENKSVTRTFENKTDVCWLVPVASRKFYTQ